MIHTIISAPYAENTYVLVTGSDSVVVDPGFEPQLILDCIAKHKLNVVAILNTHGHEDHIAGNEAMKTAFPNAPLMIGRGDAPMLTDANLNLSAWHGPPMVSPPADRLLDEGEVLELAGYRFTVREIPGHSPGHVVFVAKDLVLGGDVLFRSSIGRTDFPGGSLQQLLSGIREKLWPLADDIIVYPGHGEHTTIGYEKKHNPFLS